MLERLQKIIAHAGIASRRHAEQLILSGQVLVNGQVVRELGTKADPSVDKIEAAGRLVEQPRKPVYLILHKPPEVVSSLADPAGRKTLRNFLRGFPERVYPVGNLDYSASGLIFLTNDGELTATMLRSWSNIPQIYHIKIKGKLMLEQLEHLGKQTKTVVRLVRQPDSTRGHAANFWYEAQVSGAKLDELGRVLEKNGHPLEKVKRIGLGPLSLEGVPVGHYVVLGKEQAAAMRNPTHGAKFFAPYKPKAGAKSAFRSDPSGQVRHHGNAPRTAPRFSKPFGKPATRPPRYTKLQRRPATPPNAPGAFEEFDDKGVLRSTTNHPPWLKGPGKFSPSTPSNRPSEKSNRPFDSSGKQNRAGFSSKRFNRPTRGSGKPAHSGSGRPKSRGNFSSRKPRPPR